MSFSVNPVWQPAGTDTKKAQSLVSAADSELRTLPCHDISFKSGVTHSELDYTCVRGVQMSVRRGPDDENSDGLPATVRAVHCVSI